MHSVLPVSKTIKCESCRLRWYENRPLGVHKLGKWWRLFPVERSSLRYTPIFHPGVCHNLAFGRERVDVGRKSEIFQLFFFRAVFSTLFFRATFSTLVIFKEMSKCSSVYVTGLITKTDFILLYFLHICSSHVPWLCDFLFGDAHFKFDSCVFFWNNQNSWLRIATNKYLLQFV